MTEEIESILHEAIDELNVQLDETKRITLNDETRFVGSKAALDSVGFVTLISIIEELVADKTGKTIQLVNEKAFSQKNSPFYSPSTIIAYIESLLSEAE